MTTIIRYLVWDEYGRKDNGLYIEAETMKEAALKYAELRHNTRLIFLEDYEVIVQSPNRVSEAFRVRTVLEPTFYAEKVD